MAALDDERFSRSTLVAALEARFGVSDTPIRIASAPGRANLIGEHTDYQDGLVMPFALEQRVYVAFRPRADDVLNAVALDLEGGDGALEGGARGSVALSALLAARKADAAAGPNTEPRWFRYVAAAFDWLTFADGSRCDRGCDLVLTSSVPRGGGVSSSSAVVVASAIAARSCNLARPLAARADGKSAFLMAVCEAEWHYSGLGGGMMDQTASLYGKRGKVFAIDCRAGALSDLDGAGDPYASADGAAFVVLNTMVAHALPDSPYARRRRSCERAAAAAAARWPDRKITHLRDLSDAPGGLEAVATLEAEGAIDAEDAARARHGVAENGRVRAASAALKRGAWAELGGLINAAHASLRDLYAVSCLELDVAQDIASELDGCYGARMMGGGFGGCVIALVDPARAAAVAADLRAAYKARTAAIPACGAPAGIDATVFVSAPGDGASLDGGDGVPAPAIGIDALWATAGASP